MARPAIFRIGPLPTTRVEAFSDGVMAVVITLLVLEVKLPIGLDDDAALLAALVRLAPALVAWLVSFAFVLTFWVSHQYFFASLEHGDRGLLWLNGLFLLTISMTPLPIGLVGRYPQLSIPIALVSATMLLASASFLAMRLYAVFCGKLLKPNIDRREVAAGTLQSAIAPLLYCAAIWLAFTWPPGALGLQLLVLAIFFVRSPSRHRDHRGIGS